MATADNTAHFWSLTPSERRIRRVLEIPPYQVLPAVNDQALRAYYEKLSDQLTLPFAAEHTEADDADREVVVLRLAPPRGERWDLETGLVVEVERHGRLERVPLVEIRVAADHPLYQFIEDYWYWFWNWRGAPGA